MAAQYNQAAYRSNRPNGRGRVNDQSQPRYRPPVQVHHNIRAQVPTGIVHSAPGTPGGRQVIMPQQMFVPGIQTSTGNFQRYQYNPAGVVYQTPTGMYPVQPMPPIYIGNPAASGIPMAQATAPTGLLNSQPFTPPQTQTPAAAPPKKRERKAIRIVNPDTGKEVDVSKTNPPESNPKDKEEPASSEEAADVAKDFQQMVKSAVGEASQTPASEPRPNAIIRHPEVKSAVGEASQMPASELRPNAIIRHPDEAKQDDTKQEKMNGIEKTSEPVPVPEPIPEPLPEKPVETVDGCCGDAEPPPPDPAPEQALKQEAVTQPEIVELEPTTSEPITEPEEFLPIKPTEEDDRKSPPLEEPPGIIEEMQPPPEITEPEPLPTVPTHRLLFLDDGPRKYTRDFLMGFAKGCIDPPAELTANTEVFVIDGGKALFHDRRVGKKGDPRRGSEPKKITHQPQPTEKVELHKAEQRWERTAKTEGADEEAQATELYRKFQGILNKLTPQKFQKLAEQALALEITTEDRLAGCIDKIFTKALEEPNFSIAYANLCKVLSPIKVECRDEQGQLKSTNFRRVLLTKCQSEFERDKKDDEKLDEMTKALEASETEEARKKLKEEMEEFQTQARRRSLGNIRFIGELFKLSMLSETIMHECIVKLLKSTSDEESLECFARLITTTGQTLDSQKAKPRIDGYFSRIRDIIKKGKIPSRIKFMLQDVQDLRSNDWVPRKAQASTLKTIDQIHAEAKLAEEEEKRNVAQHQALSSYKGGRGEEKKRQEFSTKGDREKVSKEAKPKIDRSRLQNLKKSDKKDSSPLLGQTSQSLRPATAWNRGTQSPTPPQDPKDKKPNRSSSTGTKKILGRGTPSSGPAARRTSQSSEQAAAVEAVKLLATGGKPVRAGSAPTSRDAPVEPAVPEAPVPDKLDEETVRRKTGTIVDELAENGDIEEAVTCVNEMASPGLLNFLVSEAINHSLEKRSGVRSAAGRLMERLLKDKILSEAKILSGVNEILEYADDIETDVPKMWVYLAEILAPVFAQCTLPLSALSKIPKQLMDSGKASVLVAEILNQCGRGQSQEEVSKLWADSKLDWTLLGVKDEDIDEFLTKRSLDFLLETPRPLVPSYFQEMVSLLGNTSTTNQEVDQWVEKLNLETKNSQFVNTLTKAMIEATVSGKGTAAIFNEEFFQKRATLLKKYIADNDEGLQLEILYGLQVAVTMLEHPPKLLNSIFHGLYDMELITDEVFGKWRDQGTETYGKGNCVLAAKSFFEWLDSASVDSDDGGGT